MTHAFIEGMLKTSILVFMLAACGGKKDSDKATPSDKAAPKKVEPTSGHCWLKPGGTADQRCWEFTPEEVRAQGPAFMTSMCDPTTGTFVENKPCPTENLVATCRGGSMITRFYGGERGACGQCPDGKMPPWTVERAAENCKETGGKLE